MSELDPNLRALLSRSRETYGPPPGVEARMLADFSARAGLDGGPDGGSDIGELDGSLASTTPASTAAQIVHGLKVVGAVLGLTAAGLGGLWLVGQATRPDPEPASVVAHAEPTPAPAPATAPVPAPLAAAIDTETAADVPAPDEPSEPTPTAKTPAAQDPTPTPAKSSAATLGAELKLIRAARSAPAEQALELLARHAQEFPKGELASEREALRAVSLCTLGRTKDAEQARARLAQLTPSPLLRDKVTRACDQED